MNVLLSERGKHDTHALKDAHSHGEEQKHTVAILLKALLRCVIVVGFYIMMGFVFFNLKYGWRFGKLRYLYIHRDS
jgi:hypothetical protein